MYWLFRDKLLPEKTVIIGYARSKLDIQQYLNEKIKDKMNVKKEDEKIYEDFVSRNYYVSGQYDDSEKFKELNTKILELTKDLNQNEADCNRIFYLAVPPSVYKSVSEVISKNCKAKE